MIRSTAALFVLSAVCLLVAACGGKNPPAVVALALDGPPLAIAGEYAGMQLEGSMERTCMAGKGELSIKAVGTGQVFACEASLDAPPTEKGRIQGILKCSGERNLAFSLRNLGPDQGVGIARESREGELMVFFYHASKEEAHRRYPEIKADMDQARSLQRGG